MYRMNKLVKDSITTCMKWAEHSPKRLSVANKLVRQMHGVTQYG